MTKLTLHRIRLLGIHPLGQQLDGLGSELILEGLDFIARGVLVAALLKRPSRRLLVHHLPAGLLED